MLQIRSDSDDFEPTPPVETDADRQHGHDVAFLLQAIEQAGRGQHVAFALSYAFRQLDKLYERGFQHRLSDADLEQLLHALAQAEAAAHEHLPEWLPRKYIAEGCRGAAELIEHWARPPYKRQRRSAFTLATARADARILGFFLRALDEEEGQRFRHTKRRRELDGEMRELERRDRAA